MDCGPVSAIFSEENANGKGYKFHEKALFGTVVSAVTDCGAAGALTGAGACAAQHLPYQPKFKGDPARSDSEAAALGYLRTFLRAQKIYKKKNGHYATTLLDLAKTGSFTRRMVGHRSRRLHRNLQIAQRERHVRNYAGAQTA